MASSWASTSGCLWLRIRPLNLMQIRLWTQLLILIGIRIRILIWLLKIMRIHSDPDPQHCSEIKWPSLEDKESVIIWRVKRVSLLPNFLLLAPSIDFIFKLRTSKVSLGTTHISQLHTVTMSGTLSSISFFLIFFFIRERHLCATPRWVRCITLRGLRAKGVR